MDLNILADRYDKLNNKRASFNAAKDCDDSHLFSSQLTLSVALKNTRIRAHFRDFVENALATENLDFYEAVEEIELITDDDEFLLAFDEILNQFILVSAPTPINLPFDLSKKLQMPVDSHLLRRNHLRVAQAEILSLMQKNFFFRFLSVVVLPKPSEDSTTLSSPPQQQEPQRQLSAKTVNKLKNKYLGLLREALHSPKSKPSAITATTPRLNWVRVHVLLTTNNEGEKQEDPVTSSRRIFSLTRQDREDCAAWLRNSIRLQEGNEKEVKRLQAEVREVEEFEAQLLGETLHFTQEDLDMSGVEKQQQQHFHAMIIVMVAILTYYFLFY